MFQNLDFMTWSPEITGTEIRHIHSAHLGKMLNMIIVASAPKLMNGRMLPHYGMQYELPSTADRNLLSSSLQVLQ